MDWLAFGSFVHSDTSDKDCGPSSPRNTQFISFGTEQEIYDGVNLNEKISHYLNLVDCDYYDIQSEAAIKIANTIRDR